MLLCITACSELCSVNIIVFQLDEHGRLQRLMKPSIDKDCDTLRLSYHHGNHYNSVKNICDLDSGKPVCKYKYGMQPAIYL